MSERKIECGWKITNRELYSVIMREDGVRYEENRWVLRPYYGGPLTVFSEEMDARTFGRMWVHADPIIHPCLYIPSFHQGVWTFDSVGKPKNFYDAKEMPQGTSFADAVYLLPR